MSNDVVRRRAGDCRRAEAVTVDYINMVMSTHPESPRRRPAHASLGTVAARIWLTAALLWAAPGVVVAANDSLVLLIQPILSAERTKQAFQPLADYLGRSADVRCVIATRPNFLAYWDTVRRREGYDLVLDAAHFTDYRIRKMGFHVLAKIPDSVSYTLLVPDTNPVIDPMELVGKSVATLGPPSIGAARLNSMFPNPARQPVIVEVQSVEEGMDLVLKRRVAGAILPTPIVSRQMAGGGGISVVATTEPIPHIALSAAPTVPSAVRERIRAALLSAHRVPDGQRMLAAIGFERFDPATPDMYADHGAILREYWGY